MAAWFREFCERSAHPSPILVVYEFLTFVWLSNVVTTTAQTMEILAMPKTMLLALVVSLWVAPAWGDDKNDLKRFLKTGVCGKCDQDNLTACQR